MSTLQNTHDATAPASSPDTSQPQAFREDDTNIKSTSGGYRFTCRDDSRWAVGRPLSARQLQQNHGPCESRQVFTATCIDDPAQAYTNLPEAVVKIKYQVRGTQRTTFRYEQDISSGQKYLKAHPECADKMNEWIQRRQAHLLVCEAPTNHPQVCTVNELYALRQLRDLESPYTPWLLNWTGAHVPEGLHEDAVVDGYYIFILMTKLPGQMLDLDQYCKLSSLERDEIRAAFREALEDVWDCGIVPQDTAARNIMWDAMDRKCYIVDFEDCRFLDLNTQVPPECHVG